VNPASARTALRACIEAELRREPPAAVRTLAARLASRAGTATAAVLFYGSALRDEALDGVLDFYVLVDDVRHWPGSALARLANRWLPPNVGYVEDPIEGRDVRAKFAVMSTAQFRAAMSPRALDTTIWARFCQPCVRVFARDDAAQAAVTDAVSEAVITAARWSAALDPIWAGPADFWRALFARTYRAELRVERSTRGDDLVTREVARYEALLPLAWTAAGIPFDRDAELLAPQLPASERALAARHWSLRRRLGKPLNALRLLKAACTFDGAADYAVWKVERHSGVKLELSPWQRRHPLLAAPGVYWQLRRRGVLR
jgi:hypothetical protein